MLCLLLLTPFVAIAFSLVYFIFLKSPPPLPNLDYNAWWGPDHLRTKQDTSIRPFKIKFDDEMIADLKRRLKNHRKLTPPLEGIAFEYGFNTNQLDSWVSYWAEQYDFKARETALNKYPQFKTNIQGLDIHFIRVKPEPSNKRVLPMLLLHGWPGSVREFYEAIPLLTAAAEDRDFTLELIIPSLVGFGFSDAAVRPGMGPAEMAVVLKNLMTRLGFSKFYIQGDNVGSIIGSIVATLFAEDVLGFHATMGNIVTPSSEVIAALTSYFPSLLVKKEVRHRFYPRKKILADLMEEAGYMHIHASKPDTIGVALADSPVGLLAYIGEKFCQWTNRSFKHLPDGGINKKFTKDQVIDNLMFYWSTNSLTTSVRLYAENFSLKQIAYRTAAIPTPVPTWMIQAEHELRYQPPFIMKLKYTNLLNTTVFFDGGYFFAFEKPKEYAENVLMAVGEFRKFHRRNNTTEM